MKIAIMQPYFCPYIGYFQLIKAVDIFVIGDDLQYTKKGWFNRNRILNNGVAFNFTIPLRKDINTLTVNQRWLAHNSHAEKVKILKRIQNFYKNAPFFSDVYPLLRKVFFYENDNLFEFIDNSIKKFSTMLSINTDLILSSSLKIAPELKAQDRVIEICKNLNATEYINAIGGKALYDRDTFNKSNIDLKFIRSKPIEYKQFNHEFVPWLSIIDVLMFNGIEKTKEYLDEYELE